MRLTGDFKQIRKLNLVKLFLSCFYSIFRHSATSFRQKNSQKFRLNFFLEFCGRLDVEKYQKVPLQLFFAELCFFHFFTTRSPFMFFMICDRRDEKSQRVPLARQSGPTVGFLRWFRRENFATLKSSCYFRSLDTAVTWAVPSLFSSL